jgi:hypothetical protein
MKRAVVASTTNLAMFGEEAEGKKRTHLHVRRKFSGSLYPTHWVQTSNQDLFQPHFAP